MLFLGTEQFPEESSASVFAIIPNWRRLESAAPGNPAFSFCFWTRFRCLSDCEQRFFQRLHRGRGPSWLDPAMEPSRNSSSYWCVVHCLVPCLQHLAASRTPASFSAAALPACGPLWSALEPSFRSLSLRPARPRERCGHQNSIWLVLQLPASPAAGQRYQQRALEKCAGPLGP